MRIKNGFSDKKIKKIRPLVPPMSEKFRIVRSHNDRFPAERIKKMIHLFLSLGEKMARVIGGFVAFLGGSFLRIAGGALHEAQQERAQPCAPAKPGGSMTSRQQAVETLNPGGRQADGPLDIDKGELLVRIGDSINVVVRSANQSTCSRSEQRPSDSYFPAGP